MRKIIGILGAMPEEIAPILERFPAAHTHILAQNKFFESHFSHAGQDFTLFIAYSKIGKVHSTLTTTLLISHFGAEKIIFCGVAGSTSQLKIGDLIAATKTCQHDVNLTACGHALGLFPESRVFFDADPKMLEIAQKTAQNLGRTLHTGIIASGDEFISSKEKNSWIFQNFGALAVDMESACVGVVCASFGVPYCILRTISDCTDEHANFNFDEFLVQTCENSAIFLHEMMKILAENQ